MRRGAPLLPLLLSLVFVLACARAEPEPLPNVRLGMSPRDVRERFVEPGNWQTQVGTGDDTILEFSAGTAKVEHARFEFHLGMLVAIRAHVRGPSSERVETTPKTVTHWVPTADGADVTVLARDCPTHKDEADALVSRSKP